VEEEVVVVVAMGVGYDVGMIGIVETTVVVCWPVLLEFAVRVLELVAEVDAILPPPPLLFLRVPPLPLPSWLLFPFVPLLIVPRPSAAPAPSPATITKSPSTSSSSSLLLSPSPVPPALLFPALL
jgi:hypothetical protein